VPYPAELVMRMYAGRADSEKRIKEFKEDLSMNEWCLQALTPLMQSFGPAVCSIYNRLVGICESGCCWGRSGSDSRDAGGPGTVFRAARGTGRIPRRLRTLSEGLKIVAQLERQLVDEEPATESPEQPASMLMLPAPMGHLKGKLRNPG
jgi:hypothetical protein